MYPIEAIVRGFLTGTAWKTYQDTNPHMVCGHLLPDGLRNGSALQIPLFTPTTKATAGHDEPLTALSVTEQYGVEIQMLAIELYCKAKEYALSRGLVLVDTKFEFGIGSQPVVLADEVLTPDSSRFWKLQDSLRLEGTGTLPDPYDKERVRQWGRNLGIDRMDPTDSADYAWVREQVLPPAVMPKRLNVIEKYSLY
jgi:phosphoribosylaminoimidazole-succinocarboxamide synthase